MKKIVLAIAMLIGMACHTYAQKFWLTTKSFPNGAKTAIALADDQTLIVGLTKGIIVSLDSGDTWTQTLPDGFINTLYTTKSGTVLAGGIGVIYLSENKGLTWHTVSMSHPHPVRQFVENSNGKIFAITGEFTAAGYVGAGVFSSSDSAYTWQPRNTGLFNTLSCFQIAIDNSDKLYLTMPDEHANGAGGLFTSADAGATWQHINVTIDGDGAISGSLCVLTPFTIAITPQDSVLFSFTGVSRTQGQSGVGVDFTLKKHIDEVDNDSFWQPVYAKPIGPMWWNGAKLNRVHYAANGDMYSSVNGTINSGGSIFRKDDNAYLFHAYGLGLDYYGLRGEQYFAENSKGKVYMIQWMDERVYHADTSEVLTDIGKPDVFVCDLYPNPVKRGDKLNLKYDNSVKNIEVRIYDLAGKELSYIGGQPDAVNMPNEEGIYLVHITSDATSSTHKIVVQ